MVEKGVVLKDPVWAELVSLIVSFRFSSVLPRESRFFHAIFDCRFWLG